MTATPCFHCGEPCPDGSPFMVEIPDLAPTCCAGCQAAVMLIRGAGLDAYYRLRTENAPKAEDSRAGEWVAYDREAVQRGLVATYDDGSHEVSLLMDGLRCAACSWLVEHALEREPAVRDVRLNAATARLLLRWNPDIAPLSHLLGRLAALGYTPTPLSATGQDQALVRERRTMLKRLWVAGLGMMQVMMYAIAVYVGEGWDLDVETRNLFNWVSLLITTPVVFYSSQPFFQGAWRGIRNRAPGMDVPVAVAIALAYAASVVVTLQGGAEVYFDSVTMFAFFLLTGRWFEMSARHRAGRMGEALGRLVPDTAELLSPRGSGPLAANEAIVGAAPRAATFVGAVELQAGDRIRVRAGDRFPCDGHLVHGSTHVDESLLTGESVPIARDIGDAVVAGSLNLDAPVEVAVERSGSATLVSGIGRLLARAQSERPRIAALADRVARWFVIVMLALAALTFLVWSYLDPARAFPITLAVLVVACPCALALATPVALTSGTLALARRGLLVTRADALEALAKVDAVVFDKTGTLTHGDMRIAQVELHQGAVEQEVLAVAAALERAAEHPIAKAFRPHDDGRAVEDLKIIRHVGVEGRVGGIRYALGRQTEDQRGSGPQCGSGPLAANANGTQVTLSSTDNCPLATFTLSDTLRSGAAALVRQLQARGIVVEILSGDHPAAVEAVARELGVSRWFARQSPEQKLARLEVIRGQRAAPTSTRWSNGTSGSRPLAANSASRTPIIAVVGDGVNDAPILAAADVAIALGTGSALAQSSAGMILLGDTPMALTTGIAIARRTLRIIRQNLGLSLFYNLGGIPLAAIGLIPPWLAAIGMAGSSLVVVLNSSKLYRRHS